MHEPELASALLTASTQSGPMRLAINHRLPDAPVCRKCRRLMRYHSTQEVELTAAAHPHRMMVFMCEGCEKWQAVPDDTPGPQGGSSAEWGKITAAELSAPETNRETVDSRQC
jgi:RNase P subunit RPR2